MSPSAPTPAALARWTVDAETLQAFAHQLRQRFGARGDGVTKLLKACDAQAQQGAEVVFLDASVQVGGITVLDFQYTDVTGVHLRPDAVEFEFEGQESGMPIPVPRGGRAAAEQVVALYRRQGEENARRDRDARAAPTLNNRLLDIAESHFVKVALGFFFVVIPALVMLAVWLLDR